MTDTIPHKPGGHRRHLSPVPSVAPSGTPVEPKPTLRPLAQLDVEQARKFLMELDTAAASASPLLPMFLLGRCAEQAQALLDVIDAAVAL